ncbi:Prostatic spermine-binding protein-like [Balamuthia mandrillaris]
MATSGAQHGPRFRKAAPLKAKEEEKGSSKDKKKAEKKERLVIARPALAVATEHNRSTPSPLASGRKIVNRKEPARKHSRNNKERSGKGSSEEEDDDEDVEKDEEEDEDDTEESDKGEDDFLEETKLEAGEELDDPDEDKKASNGKRVSPVTQKDSEQRRVIIAKQEGKARWSRSRSARSNPRVKREEQSGSTSSSPTPSSSSSGSSPRLPTATSSPSIAGRSPSTTSRTSSRRTASPNTSEARKNRKGQRFVFNENETEGGSAPPASSVSTQEQTPSAPLAARRPKRGEVVAIKVGKDDGEIKAEEERQGAAISSSSTSPTKKLSWYNVRRRRSEHIASINVVKDGLVTATIVGG